MGMESCVLRASTPKKSSTSALYRTGGTFQSIRLALDAFRITKFRPRLWVVALYSVLQQSVAWLQGVIANLPVPIFFFHIDRVGACKFVEVFMLRLDVSLVV